MLFVPWLKLIFPPTPPLAVFVAELLPKEFVFPKVLPPKVEFPAFVEPPNPPNVDVLLWLVVAPKKPVEAFAVLLVAVFVLEPKTLPLLWLAPNVVEPNPEEGDPKVVPELPKPPLPNIINSAGYYMFSIRRGGNPRADVIGSDNDSDMNCCQQGPKRYV